MEDETLKQSIEKVMDEEMFSGAVMINKGSRTLFTSAAGFANRADQLPNTVDTRFGIASGCKLFTAIAVCQLAEQGKILLDDRLKDCLDIEFSGFDENITVHHLLTHSAGIPDYFDEAVMDDFEDLWKLTPMYLLRTLEDFLPLFRDGQMMFRPGEKFHYNNAGYILLGLIIEQQSGLSFQEYVEREIFKPCGMDRSGYFALDQLPGSTAYGYLDMEDGSYKTNIYSIPATGGADGGAFVTAPDMVKLWDGLLGHKLLSEEYTRLLMTPHIHVKKGVSYGYGMWINDRDGSIYKYHVMGYDPGVSFHSAYYPDADARITAVSNLSSGAFAVMKAAEEAMFL
ncbi:serine hydrolase domain-containing protein [Bacillus marinisedimentorum]|uniref:serine hydrolase domain-containing protein n=1 Tax=Bacillus marinisedimentorum TaxID=1821260 RepID=UPI000ADEFC53|nr:serine hydrolase domain-containing protein [Bacillus marinisedimentorum]